MKDFQKIKDLLYKFSNLGLGQNKGIHKNFKIKSNIKDYQIIENLLYKFSNLGLEKSLETGAIKIGRAPHIAPLAVLNCIYPTINNEQVNYIETEIGRPLPESLKSFMTHFSNGLGVLCDTLCLYGLRLNYIRSIEMVWQPFDIILPNKLERPDNAKPEMIMIGSYNWDGSKIYMSPDGRVHYCARWDATSLKSWDSLTTMLIEEIERLYTLFDARGVQINEEQPTTPLVL